MKTLPELLESFPLTRGLAPELRELIAGCGRNAVYPPGAYLCREGEDADTFWAIRGGRVSIEIYSPGRGALGLETVGEGDILGWSWIFPPYRTVFDARVLERTRAIAFDGACLREKAEADPALGYALMTRMAGVFTRRLTSARLRLLDLYGQPAQR